MTIWQADPEHFHQAIQSVGAQTLTDWELVIVEDPSDRPMADAVSQLNDTRIRYELNSRRTNIVDQLNRGLDLCGADLVARFDGDDICDPERLECQVEYMNSHPNICVLGTQLRIVDGKGAPIGNRHYPTEHEQILRELPLRNPLAHPSVMFRRHDIVAAGGYRGVEKDGRFLPWCQDYELWSRLANAGLRFANHPAPLVTYRLHDDQIKSKHVHDVLDTLWLIKQTHWRHNMTWAAYLRMWAEQILRLMPAKLCLWLFERIQVDRTPSQTRDKNGHPG